MDFMKITEKTYEEKYKSGYGVMYPDGHVIRIYEHFLKNRMEKIQNKKLFDFGCGNGTHALYFENKGFETSGVDISKVAIEICKNRINKGSENFKEIEPGENFDKYYNVKFEVIFSNQTLYYLDDDNLKNMDVV